MKKIILIIAVVSSIIYTQENKINAITRKENNVVIKELKLNNKKTIVGYSKLDNWSPDCIELKYAANDLGQKMNFNNLKIMKKIWVHAIELHIKGNL